MIALVSLEPLTASLRQRLADSLRNELALVFPDVLGVLDVGGREPERECLWVMSEPDQVRYEFLNLPLAISALKDEFPILTSPRLLNESIHSNSQSPTASGNSSGDGAPLG